MYTIKDLKKFIEVNNLPDDMPVGLLDTTTDDYGKAKGKMLFITFENVLNENPI